MPVIVCDDPAAARDFYVDMLGFRVAMDEDGMLMLASTSVPTTQLILCWESPTAVDPAVREVAISIEVADVDAAYAEAVKRGLEIVRELADETWGIRRFFARDPAGQIVNIAQHLRVKRGSGRGRERCVAQRAPERSRSAPERYCGRVLELQRLNADHLQALFAFELENRDYFARSVRDRGDEFFETFAKRLRALLDEQDAGISVFFVLVDGDGSIVGRLNLYDLDDGAAEVGYRVAERVAGRGVATQALSDLCRKAARDHGLRTLTAGTAPANVASQRVLEKAGFVATGTCVVDGEPSLMFMLSLAGLSRDRRAS